MSEPASKLDPAFTPLYALGEYLTGPTPDKYSQHEKELQNRVALAMQRRQYARTELALTIPPHASGNPTPVFLPGVRVEATWKAKEEAADNLASAVNELEAAEKALAALWVNKVAWDDSKARAHRDRKYQAVIARRDTYERCKREHEQAKADYTTSTWKPADTVEVYYVVLNGQRWLFDVNRPADPMPEDDFDLHQWLKWGLRPKRGRKVDEGHENEPVWFSREDRNGLELRAYIRLNHPNMPRALARIARSLRLEGETPLAVNQ
jgi:hypothetical protein